jgi:hypothetical protein
MVSCPAQVDTRHSEGSFLFTVLADLGLLEAFFS